MLMKGKVVTFLTADAAKKYHEYLVRQLKPVGEEKIKRKAKNRTIQRRQRVCVQCSYSIIILSTNMSLTNLSQWQLSSENLAHRANFYVHIG